MYGRTRRTGHLSLDQASPFELALIIQQAPYTHSRKQQALEIETQVEALNIRVKTQR